MMRKGLWLVLFASIAAACFAADKPTSLADANAAIDANMKTPEGKAYDQKLGGEFSEKYKGVLRNCKQSAGTDLGSFWFLIRLDAEGRVSEVLLHPETAIGTCARKTLLRDRFSRPPRGDYWVGVYLKITH